MATFKDVIEVLGKFYGTSDNAELGQLRARVQNFQRLGIPVGMQLGKGRKIDYGRDEIYQVVLCLELTELGMTPSGVAFMLKMMWCSDLSAHFQKEWTAPSIDDNRLLVFSPNSMSGAFRSRGAYRDRTMKVGDDTVPYSRVEIKKESALHKKRAKAFLGAIDYRHVSIINMTTVVSDFEKLLVGVLPPVDAGKE